MITEEQLNSLADFGKEDDGCYSDRWQFDIIKDFCGIDNWNLYLFNEVDGSRTFIKRLKDFDDLKNVYKAINDKDIRIK